MVPSQTKVHLELQTHLQLRKTREVHLYAPYLIVIPSTPLPLSPNGILPDGSVINYTPNNPSNRQHSCWTVPKSIPPPSNKYQNGTCTVCVVQRNGTEKGSDYQLWARDNDNNAMGDMKAETVWPVDAQQPNTSVAVTLLMGGSFLTIAPELSSYDPRISHVTLEWKNAATQIVDFDYAAPHFGDNCTDAGNALNGAVRYVTCFFDC